jgi:hypothetical protein
MFIIKCIHFKKTTNSFIINEIEAGINVMVKESQNLNENEDINIKENFIPNELILNLISIKSFYYFSRYKWFYCSILLVYNK